MNDIILLTVAIGALSYDVWYITKGAKEMYHEGLQSSIWAILGLIAINSAAVALTYLKFN